MKNSLRLSSFALLVSAVAISGVESATAHYVSPYAAPYQMANRVDAHQPFFVHPMMRDAIDASKNFESAAGGVRGCGPDMEC